MKHSGYQVWKSNGTDAGTVKVLEVNGFSKPTKLTDVGGILYFSVDDGLWRSDGTETGTFPIAILPHDDLTYVNGTLYFLENSRQVYRVVEKAMEPNLGLSW